LDPLNQLRNIGSNERITLACQWAEEGTELVKLFNNLLLSLVLSKVALNISYDHCANTASCLESFTFFQFWIRTGTTESNLSAECFWVFTVNDPLNHLRDVLCNNSITSTGQWAKKGTDLVKLIDNLLFSLVLLNILFNILYNQFTDTASSLHDFTFGFKGTKANLSAERLWVLTVLDPLNQLRKVGRNKLIACGRQWAKKGTDLVKLIDNLLFSLVVGQIRFDILDNQFADAASALMHFAFNVVSIGTKDE